MLFRTLMMLSGTGAKGTLRLSMENGAAKAAVAVSGLPKDGEYSVYLFFSEDKSINLGRLKDGEWQGTVNIRQDAKACGVVRDARGGEIFVMTGETGDFNWEKAKSNLYLKTSLQKKPLAVPEEEPLENYPAPPLKPGEPPEKEEEPVREQAVQMPPYVSSLEFREPDAFLDAVKESSEEEEELIERAREAFEESKQDACENCPLTIRKSPIQPFFKQYQDYVWEKTEYPGLQGYWHYITGKLYENGVLKKIAIGVPGDYALNPPNWLYGFNTYAYADEGEVKGYWILFEDA